LKPSSKTLHFPLAGVVKKYPYSQSPVGVYGSPDAVNVRGLGVFDSRLRGGSRPPLVLVTAVNPVEADTAFLWPNGEPIYWTDDVLISYDILLPQAVTSANEKIVRRDTLMNAVATEGAIPSGYTITAIYRNRLVLIKDDLWYMSRQGDYSDFDLGADTGDVGRAVAGGVALSGDKVEAITAIAVVGDSHMFVATVNSLWVIKGDPTTGNMTRISEDVGIVSAWAWALRGSELAFLSNDGIYLLSGDNLQRFSEDRIPESLRNVDTSTITPLMIYDVSARGYHLFLTPATGDGVNYWLELENRALWPVSLETAHQPTALATLKGSNISEVALLGKDSVWRKFDPEAEAGAIVETTGLASSVKIGPVQLSQAMQDGFLAEVYGSIATGSANVTVAVSTGHSPEEAVDATASFSFTFKSGWNRVVRPRVRGAWCVFTLTSSGQWAFESLSFVSKQLGRLR